ncbi:carbonic anhydrase [Pseudovirgaria hyperparasitica]|uniref:Carbonic anhydrase n=1 Tax=Pseudovirgaria hyperparasitica TaxID=470096 RepID=A0A6A6W0W6_9PEZI|nr:carbonic anhydrase [Pseudovirgaria hyperparasitica]KAF2756542.1 carbonic anhydrase [Pseudovirgaria hyperparasitica]
MLSILSLTLCAASLVLACSDHTEYHRAKRQIAEKDWAYEASYNWGKINPGKYYELCQTGTMQSPIPLLLTQGLSLNHRPTFNFPETTNGTFRNWGYGPGFNVYTGADITKNPSVTFEENIEDPGTGALSSRNETAYLLGWHIHSPADHSVGGDRSKAELHFVFAKPDGHERAVFAVRIDPGNSESAFFAQLPNPLISWRDAATEKSGVEMNLNLALEEANTFNEFWTYRGSLTSPPCTEGLRWFVARNILFVSNAQMQEILRVSTYSARAEQEVWLHAVNV